MNSLKYEAAFRDPTSEDNGTSTALEGIKPELYGLLIAKLISDGDIWYILAGDITPRSNLFKGLFS